MTPFLPLQEDASVMGMKGEIGMPRGAKLKLGGLRDGADCRFRRGASDIALLADRVSMSPAWAAILVWLSSWEVWILLLMESANKRYSCLASMQRVLHPI